MNQAAPADGPPFTEPVIVPCLYVTGVSVEIRRHLVRFIGWVAIPDLGGETEERRIVVRFAMDSDDAFDLRESLITTMRRNAR